MDKLIRAVLELEPLASLDLQLSEPEPSELVPGVDTKQLDDLLQEAEHQGLIYGNRQGGAGSTCWWSKLEPSRFGLQRLGEWPPAGGEFLPGPWDDGYWGQLARPLLQVLAEDPPEHGYLFAPAMGATNDEWRRWQAIQQLLQAGLIRGGLGGDGISNMAVTDSGRKTLSRDTGDPLDRALIELQRGAKAEALIAAVEEVLRPRILELADENGVDTWNAKGKPVALASINEQLGARGALRQDVRAEIAAYLQMRNEGGHGRAAGVSGTRIARAIAGIRELRDDGLI